MDKSFLDNSAMDKSSIGKSSIGKSVTVSAAANVALIKYWGKRRGDGNQPATPSLSIGLDDLRTTTQLGLVDGTRDSFDPSTQLVMNEQAQDRIRHYLDQFRATFGQDHYFSVATTNNFPTGSGLASSASGFAALAIGLNTLCELNLDKIEVSKLARRGSGSAARSIYGGYVEIVNDDDAFAAQIDTASAWPLDVVVAVTAETPKSINSTDAMTQTAETSPMYAAWLQSHEADMSAAREAIANKNFQQLAEVSEFNCLKMHATMITSQPGVLYWLPGTLEVMHRVRLLREQGSAAFFSIDAGSQVKVVCMPEATATVKSALADAPGVLRLIETRVGGEPEVTFS